MAKPGPLKKYAKIYIDQGFDVLTMTVTPWQLLWPTKGSQVIQITELHAQRNKLN